MDADAGGTFTVTGQLYLTDGADVQTDDGDADTDNNVFAYGDNLYVLVDEDGALAMFEEGPTFGTAIGVDYRAAGATTTGNELPAVTRTFSRTGAGALETSVDHTTDYLHIDGEIDNSTNDVTVTLNSGGTYQVNDGAVVDEGLSLQMMSLRISTTSRQPRRFGQRPLFQRLHTSTTMLCCMMTGRLETWT